MADKNFSPNFPFNPQLTESNKDNRKCFTFILFSFGEQISTQGETHKMAILMIILTDQFNRCQNFAWFYIVSQFIQFHSKINRSLKYAIFPSIESFIKHKGEEDEETFKRENGTPIYNIGGRSPYTHISLPNPKYISSCCSRSQAEQPYVSTLFGEDFEA